MYAATLARWKATTQPIARVQSVLVGRDPFANAVPCHQTGCSYTLFTSDQLFHSTKRSYVVLVQGSHISHRGVGND